MGGRCTVPVAQRVVRYAAYGRHRGVMRRHGGGTVRTDDDFITGTGGFNALFVAAARALEAQRDDPLAVDPFAEVFCRAVGGSWADVLDGNAPDHRLKSDFGEVFQTFLGARTKFFDD